ncbi:MAG: cupin domain-containing protein [Planctomycetia bacterium]|nr:cupin domain-containing protein [Planctomycetia bacterium]
MAIVTVPAESRRITDATEIRDFLAERGLHYEQWPLEDRVDPAAPPEAILAAYAPEIDELKARGGFVTADVIDVRPETPNLDTMLAKFAREHTHTEDEVRFILQGRGVFHVNPVDRPVFAIEVHAGDLISVPLGTRHWFDLCADRRIRAIRLFQDTSGWTPHYLEDGVHGGYEPLCLGPAWVPAEGRAAS